MSVSTESLTFLQSETLQIPDISESDKIKYAMNPDMQYHGTDGEPRDMHRNEHSLNASRRTDQSVIRYWMV